MEMITITTEYIKLQDLLKLAAITATGDVVEALGRSCGVQYAD